MTTRLLVAALLAGATAAPAAELRARFIGNMAFQLSDGRATLRTDFPYESGYSGYMTWTDAALMTRFVRAPALGDLGGRRRTRGSRRLDARPRDVQS